MTTPITDEEMELLKQILAALREILENQKQFDERQKVLLKKALEG